ncbi:MAG: C39 family peptidase [Proteobacteria bacterium]|nr:C39 family peptidase [Pseudomonadota bacterium]
MPLKRAVLALLFVSLAGLFSGCAPVGSVGVVESIRATPESGAYIEGVPFFPDRSQMCGPAVLASVVRFLGGTGGATDARLFEDISRAVYREKLKGALLPDMLAYARAAGFNAEVYVGSFEDLKQRLKSGRPLILFINLGLDIYPVGHYIVVTGYSDAEQAVVAHSGLDRDRVYGYTELESAWRKTGYSTLLVTGGPLSDSVDR